MRAILAVNKLGYIGLNGILPWHSKPDFRHFKEMTMDYTLLVGYNTYQTLPPLKDRIVILDDNSPDIADYTDWCIGGKKTYEKYMSQFTEVHLSVIDNDTIGDTMCPMFYALPVRTPIHIYVFSATGEKHTSCMANMEGQPVRGIGNILAFAEKFRQSIPSRQPEPPMELADAGNKQAPDAHGWWHRLRDFNKKNSLR